MTAAADSTIISEEHNKVDDGRCNKEQEVVPIIDGTAAAAATTTCKVNVDNDDNNDTTTSSLLLPSTEMLYMTYEGNWMLECTSRVLKVERKQDTTAMTTADIILDRTVLHAQGGGQPTDIGTISVVIDKNNESSSTMTEKKKNSPSVHHVTKVLLDRSTGIAKHTVILANNTTNNKPPTEDEQEEERLLLLPQVGDMVQVKVDAETRQILSECHTSGHVVDSAMTKIGKCLKPSKAYHFLQGPYVEYVGSIPADEKETVLTELQNAFCQLIEDDIPTNIELMNKDDADLLCNRQAQNFDMDIFADPRSDNQIRVVTVAGYPCPCGSTHVSSTGCLKQNGWNITGIKSKKGVVRVKYGQTTTNNKKNNKN